MKKTIQILFTFLIILFCVYWVYRGNIFGKKEWEEEKQKEIKGKIVRKEKPEGHKIIILYFSDSTTYRPFTNKLNDVATVGDSIYKPKNSYRLMLFKNGNLGDTMSFEERVDEIRW